jgi:hypothetical protein
MSQFEGRRHTVLELSALQAVDGYRAESRSAARRVRVARPSWTARSDVECGRKEIFVIMRVTHSRQRRRQSSAAGVSCES